MNMELLLNKLKNHGLNFHAKGDLMLVFRKPVALKGRSEDELIFEEGEKLGELFEDYSKRRPNIGVTFSIAKEEKQHWLEAHLFFPTKSSHKDALKQAEEWIKRSQKPMD